MIKALVVVGIVGAVAISLVVLAKREGVTLDDLLENKAATS